MSGWKHANGCSNPSTHSCTSLLVSKSRMISNMEVVDVGSLPCVIQIFELLYYVCHICSRGCPQNVNLRPRVVLDTQVWLSARDGDGRSHILAVALWLTPEESAWQRLWKGRSHYNRLLAQSGRRNQKEQTQSTPIPTCVQWNFRMWL